MVRRLTLQPDDGTTPAIDERDPAELIPAAVAEVLAIAESWLRWDSRPVYFDGNMWTPHKALRRVGDHLLDHLAEMECRRAGHPTFPDLWHGRMATMDVDFARFTEIDLDETTRRLTRLGACYRARLSTLDSTQLDARPEPAGWTLREVVHHVANVTYYARAMSGPGDSPR